MTDFKYFHRTMANTTAFINFPLRLTCHLCVVWLGSQLQIRASNKFDLPTLCCDAMDRLPQHILIITPPIYDARLTREQGMNSMY